MTQSESYCRLTFTENQTTPSEIYRGIFQVALTSYGNQRTQLQKFHTKFVREYKWLSESQYKQILNLCWTLPGPTITQFIITIVMLKLRSLPAGLIAFLIFSIPAWIILFLLGCLSSYYIVDANQLSNQIKLAILGFNAAAAGVMVRSFWQIFEQHYQSIPKMLIILFSFINFIIFKSAECIGICLLTGSIISLYTQIQNKKKISEKSEAILEKVNFHPLFGKNSLYALILIFAVLWIWTAFYPDSLYTYIFNFYSMGCFIVGSNTTIFAYIVGNFIEENTLSQDQVWLGVPFAFLCPGTIVNVGIYFGSLIDGLRGAILSAIFLYLPCFLSIYGILPKWRYYRQKSGIQRLNKGITCVTTGFVLAIIVLSLQHSMKTDFSLTICIFIISMFLNHVWGVYSFLIILIGGLLANSRRWGLIYYRMVPDPY